MIDADGGVIEVVGARRAGIEEVFRDKQFRPTKSRRRRTECAGTAGD